MFWIIFLRDSSDVTALLLHTTAAAFNEIAPPEFPLNVIYADPVEGSFILLTESSEELMFPFTYKFLSAL